MKKKREQSDRMSGQSSADYVVGQVSGSLFQNAEASASPLLALFGRTAPATKLVFQPPAKPVQKTKVEKEKLTEVRGQADLVCRKQLPRMQSKAEQRLEDREIGLQVADEDEQQKKNSKKRKRKIDVMEGKAEENGVGQWVENRQRKRAKKEEEDHKGKRTVFVGNLPISCTKKMLQNLFKDEGSIESIRFRSVVREDPSMSRKVAVIKRKIHPKKQSMNAYVVFKEEGGVAKALKRNGLEIQKDFHIRVDKVGGDASHDHKRSVFVGNLSFDINELPFRRHFEECGSVEAVRLVRDQNSGLGKGFGYVLFESPDAVQLALKLDGSKLEGRSIRVKRSLKKSETKAQGRPARSPGPQRAHRQRKNQAPMKSFTSFSGIKADPHTKTKTKQAKKKAKPKRAKPKKSVHI